MARATWVAAVLVLIPACSPFGEDGPEDAGLAAYRPPYTPVSIAALGAGGLGKGFAPARLLPSHQACLERGAQACVPHDGDCFGTEVNCDETADCGPGRICCIGPDDFIDTVWSTYCRSECRSSEAQVCKVSTECGGVACLPIPCLDRTLGTCGGVAPDACR